MEGFLRERYDDVRRLNRWGSTCHCCRSLLHIPSDHLKLSEFWIKCDACEANNRLRLHMGIHESLFAVAWEKRYRFGQLIEKENPSAG